MNANLVGATRTALEEGWHYDVDVTARVAALLDREVTRELGTDVYRARGWLGDRDREKALEALLADGWRFAGDVMLEDGARYMLRNCTTYVGYEVATYHAPHAVRALRRGNGFVFVRKGARVSGWPYDSKALVREGWSS
jgi:hypothetical protein